MHCLREVGAMNIAALQQRIRLGEDSTLELKRVAVSPASKVTEPHADGLSDELAAMGNAAGGTLVLGVDDKTRAVTGIPLEWIDQVEAWVTAICTDRIKPPLDVVTRHLELPGEDGSPRAVIVLDVPRSLWVHEAANGYFRRVGHAKRKLTPDALARLFQQRSQARIIHFEEQDVPGCSFDDFDALLVRRFLKPGEGETSAQLRRLHLLREVDGVSVPTVVGTLLCTLEPSRWLRNAEIIAVAHLGIRNNPDEQIDAREIGGPLDRQILDAFHFVERNMTTAARKPLGRIDYPQYALLAVFEAIVNAVAHRDYSLHSQRIRLFLFRDRLEIHSPGGLPNTLSLESMTRLSSPRNEVLSSLFGRYYPLDDPRLGRSYFMERRGYGVETILGESEQLSGKRPVYEQVGDLELCLTIFAAAPPARAGASEDEGSTA
jgi:predicted HTH transcriptional regulator